MTSPPKYWLYRWLDESDIKASDQVRKALRDPASYRRLVELVSEEVNNYEEELEPIEISDGILAGRKTDLSGLIQCSHLDCVRQRIEDTFPRMWHYFDQIVLEGCNIYNFLDAIEDNDSGYLAAKVEQEAQVLLYLRDAGAEPFIVFTTKPRFCEDHFSAEAQELGIHSYFKEKDKERAITWIIDNARFGIHRVGDSYRVAVEGPHLPEPYVRYFTGLSRKPSKRNIAKRIIMLYSSALVTDISAAHYLRLPLAETVGASWLAQKASPSQVSETDVVLSLNLPILNEISMKDFLKLREDERPYFEKFRTALKRSIRQELSSAETQTATPAQVAHSVVEDIVKPELNDIECRMRSGRRALMKKTALNVSVGATTVAIGMLDKMPLIVPIGAAAIAASLSFANKQIDKRSALEVSPYYFLWRASRVAP